MRLEDVSELAALMSRNGVLELDYQSPQGARVRLSRTGGGASSPPQPVQVAVAEAVDEAQRASTFAVQAGMGGIFHRSPAPGEPPYVRVGDRVQEGQTLALMEAMKMLLPLEAPVAGVIRHIHAQDGQSVLPSTLVLEIEPEEQS